MEEVVYDLKKIIREHQNCKIAKENLLEDYKNINKSYQYQLKIAKQLALLEITEENEEKKRKTNKEENEKDDVDKAINL